MEYYYFKGVIAIQNILLHLSIFFKKPACHLDARFTGIWNIYCNDTKRIYVVVIYSFFFFKSTCFIYFVLDKCLMEF